MKFAKSMKYGGELIEAADCDHSDFKRFIPLCPNCSEPVFLRKGSDRLSKYGKEFLIRQHWSHFNSVSEEHKAICEARVSAYTEDERERIQNQARQQRLKWIQRWFWKIWEEHVLSEYDGTCSMTIVYDADHWKEHSLMVDRRSSCFDPVYFNNFERMVEDLSKKTVEDFMGYKPSDYEPLDEKWRQFVLKATGKTLEEFNQERLLIYLEIKSLKNVVTAFEASRYLCSKRSSQLIAECFYSIYIGDWNIARESYNDTRTGSAEEKSEKGWEDRVSKISADYMIGKLLCIPWAHEFARLDTEANVPKS